MTDPREPDAPDPAPPTEAVPAAAPPTEAVKAPPPSAHAAEIATATSSASQARVAAEAARKASEVEVERRGRGSVPLILIVLGLGWAGACLAAVATVVYHSTNLGEASLRQAIAKQNYMGSSGYVPAGPIPADFVVDANLFMEEDYAILTVGKVRLAYKANGGYSYGNYQLNANPSPDGPGYTSASSGYDFEFRVTSAEDRTEVTWNRLRFYLKGGKLYLGDQAWAINGPVVTVFFDRDGKLVEALGYR
ncbi:MAG: hypothetical protein R3F62_22355 [Planctomycetota bacterium]